MTIINNSKGIASYFDCLGIMELSIDVLTSVANCEKCIKFSGRTYKAVNRYPKIP
ncbi:hypothetical protein [uncultured Gilliamella sp.]|uniref:hypothetical protein n=1 Tax=uncultured Gilliamella sp. TaxID=1193505 RepID=UPI0025EFA258|nr:hypothetical protein [uncultured Gilliamella sp.]